MFRSRIVGSGLGGYGGIGPSGSGKLYPRYFGHSQLRGYGRYGGYSEVGLSSLLVAILI